ncbi:response regulator [Paenibacillus barcinonensis]|uniref:AraC family two component transcriptional regulator n=1 Tax=Paenibacillus barcinonensis TaxID=198119 RepID=A0A2V4VBA4_PAEBA|nr:helix-turn-helix domain-containing protein [Paenibacillus barcinonensis]PYE49647.1 AraC family two component transcriptional regulator [Paenibacillus barcinonensis]QKS56647.1 response regulator [Paenibacillus barcinonensis]
MYKVIVADDEPFMLEGWRTMIDWQGCGYELCGTATDGEEALELIGMVNPDLVVTDIQMPVLDGLGLIRTMREELRYDSQIVIVTGYSEFGYAQQAIRYRVNEYVLKPLVPEEIHELLRSMIVPLELQRQETAQLFASEQLEAAQLLDTPAEVNDTIGENDLENMTSHAKQLLTLMEAGDIKGITTAVDQMMQEIQGSLLGLSLTQSMVLYIHGELLRKYRVLGADSMLLQDHTWHQTERWITGELKRLFVRITETFAAATQSDAGTGGLVTEAVQYLKQHYRSKIKLQQLANHIHVNAAYLGQQFKREMGVSFSEYVHRLRIEEARRLLRRTNMKISDIAFELGYHDAEYFTEKFKALTGELPSLYKNNSQG